MLIFIFFLLKNRNSYSLGTWQLEIIAVQMDLRNCVMRTLVWVPFEIQEDEQIAVSYMRQNMGTFCDKEMKSCILFKQI